MVEGMREFPRVSFITVVIPLMRARSHELLDHLPNDQLLNTITFGIRFQHINVERTQTIRL